MKHNTLDILSPEDTQALPLEQWFSTLGKGRDNEALDTIEQAFLLAAKKYRGWPKKGGELPLQRIFTIVDSLHKLNLDADALVAATLYTLVADDLISLKKIKKQFGKKVASLVEGVSKMSFINELKYGTQNSIGTQEQTENLRKMILAMVEDVRVMLIKLAERLHDMRMLKHLPETQQRRIARETLDIFAPLANRLGIWQIKWELEDMALRYLKPDVYKRIAGRLEGRRDNREKYIETMIDLIQKRLKQAGIKAEVAGRPKHIYSIWNKMKQKNLEVHQVHDKLAVRVLVDTEAECYTALGVVHKAFPPIHGEFDDYIASPKNNDYKSLHTAVIAEDQQVLEVQLRTHDMHYNSEFGVAAHWRYKEGRSDSDKVFDQKLEWLRQVLTWQEEESNAIDFIERFKSELLEKRVYILSPKGQIIDLPHGSTPIDYAYHIHTELGHRCRGALINTHALPLNYILKTGDKVEILKSKEPSPRRHWLDCRLGYIKTSRARTRVRQWLKQRDSGQHIADGRSALDKELERLNITGLDLNDLAKHFDYDDLDSFLAALGRDDLRMGQIINVLTEKVFPNKHVSSLYKTPSNAVQGYDRYRMYTATCCKPIPDDEIIGHLNPDGSIAVHHQTCNKVLHWQQEKDEYLLPVMWNDSHNDSYPVDIEVHADDRFGLLHDISGILTEEHINVRRVDTCTNAEQVATLALVLEVKDLRQLSRALEKVDNLSNIISVHRKVSQ